MLMIYQKISLHVTCCLPLLPSRIFFLPELVSVGNKACYTILALLQYQYI